MNILIKINFLVFSSLLTQKLAINYKTYLTNCFNDGVNLVKTTPSTAASYSAIVGILPKSEDSTTTGVEDNKDSPFFSPESLTTLPENKRVEVAMTVSPGSAFS